MKVGQIGPTFLVPWKIGLFLGQVTSIRKYVMAGADLPPESDTVKHRNISGKHKTTSDIPPIIMIRWCKKTARWAAQGGRGGKSGDSTWGYCSPQVGGRGLLFHNYNHHYNHYCSRQVESISHTIIR